MADEINLEGAAEGVSILGQLSEAAVAANENLAVLSEGAAVLTENSAVLTEAFLAEIEVINQKNEAMVASIENQNLAIETLMASAETNLAIAEQDKAILDEKLAKELEVSGVLSELDAARSEEEAVAHEEALTRFLEESANFEGLAALSGEVAARQIGDLKNLAKASKGFVKDKKKDLKDILSGEKDFSKTIGSELKKRLGDVVNFDLQELASEENLQKGLDFLQQQADSKYKAVRVAAKAAAMIDVGIDTAKAAMSAYQSLAGIPLIGPGLGVIAAGAAIAMGARQIAKIASQPVAAGGMIRGPGTETSDSIPAILSDGEYVVRAQSVRGIGIDRLNYMNQTGRMPAFQEGGFVGEDMISPAGANVNITINALDSADVEDFARNRLFPIIEEAQQERTLTI